MNQKTNHKILLLVAAVSLGLAVSARAADKAAASAPSSDNDLGLLGQTYGGLTFSDVNLHHSPVNADRYGFEYNRPLNTGFDANFTFDRTQADLRAGDRAYTQALDASLRSFSTSQRWGKPYVEAGIGYAWEKAGGVMDHSFAWIAGAGIEFQTTNALTVTPFVRGVRNVGFADRDTFEYGVKANYWVTRKWAVAAAIDRNDRQDMAYQVGFNTRF